MGFRNHTQQKDNIMAANTGLDYFVGKSVVVSLRDTRMEEISGTIKNTTDVSTIISFDSRGSSYTYAIPHTTPIYVKGTLGSVSKFKAGDEVTAELKISRIVKLKGKVISTDELGFILEYTSHSRVVKEYFPKSSIRSVIHAVLTEEGKAASAERSERMSAARGGKVVKPVAKVGAKPALRRAA